MPFLSYCVEANLHLQSDLSIQEEECVSPPMMSEDLSPVAGPVSGSGSGPVYKRCHLCVRIFSTKANLSSHIRHVHMGEAKHSRVKSIPCPHCNKMFSRKVTTE